jgi:hypothetical protein
VHVATEYKKFAVVQFLARTCPNVLWVPCCFGGGLPVDVARRSNEADVAAWLEKFMKEVPLSVQLKQQGQKSRTADHQSSCPIDASTERGFRKAAGDKVKRFIRYLTRVGPRAGRDRRCGQPQLSQHEDIDASTQAKFGAMTLGLSGAGASVLSEPRCEPSRGFDTAPSPRSEEDEGSRAAGSRTT